MIGGLGAWLLLGEPNPVRRLAGAVIMPVSWAWPARGVEREWRARPAGRSR